MTTAIQIQEQIDEIEAARWPTCACCGRQLIWTAERRSAEAFACRHCGISYDKKRRAMGLLA